MSGAAAVGAPARAPLAGHLLSLGFDAAVGVPDSHLAAVVAQLGEAVPVHTAVREDAAVAFACGLALGGGRPLVFMKNAGLFTAGDALVSLAEDAGVSLFLLVGWAGAGTDRLPHHTVTGVRTERYLDALGVETHRCTASPGGHTGRGHRRDHGRPLRAGYARVRSGEGHFAVLVAPA